MVFERIRPLTLILFVLALLPVAAGAENQPEVRVSVKPVESRSVNPGLEFVGRVDAVEKVEIRARVKGYLQSVDFAEGQIVNAGDPLYEIEPDLFEADVLQARGALERAKAAKSLSALQLERAAELLRRQTGTVADRDKALAADQQAQGQVLSDTASLDRANINLGYAKITSPISGQIGRTLVTKGNVVGPESGVLATIVSRDPMYVTFPISQREFLRVRANQKATLSSVSVNVRFADGTTYPSPGRVDFIDVVVDRATDTVTARATIPNPQDVLKDGQLVSVRLESDKPEMRLVVPQAALLADQEGVFVYVVVDGKAAVRRIRTGAESGADVIVADGLKQGDLVVVTGLQNVRPGVAVSASPAAESMPGRS